MFTPDVTWCFHCGADFTYSNDIRYCPICDRGGWIVTYRWNWGDVLERALWTAVQAQPVTFALDAATNGEIPARGYLIAAAVGFASSFVKTVAQERMVRIDTRRPL